LGNTSRHHDIIAAICGPFSLNCRRFRPYCDDFIVDVMLFPQYVVSLYSDDVRELDGLNIGRYLLYVQHFLESSAFDRFTGGPVGSNERPEISQQPWFNVAGIRFVIAAAGSSYAPGELAEKIR